MKSRWLLTAFSSLLFGLCSVALMADQPPPTVRPVPPSERATPPSEGTTTPGQLATPPSQEAIRPGQRTDVRVDVQTGEKAAGHEHGMACRASNLIGMNVTNPAGEKLGSINDLVVDPKTGTIRYAALARGGFLGIGEKLVAVPWEAFEFQTKDVEQRAFRGDDESEATGVVSKDRFTLILNIDAKTLEEHPGFDDTWPKSGDQNLMKGRTPAEQSVPLPADESLR
jgi:sporulation protein YlmC with PRC-barrel domain